MYYLIFLFLLCGSFNAEAYNPKLASDNYFISKNYKKEALENFALHWAREFNLDTSVVLSVIAQESSWNHKAVSVVDAKGLMQLLPSTAKDMGMRERESLFNPYTNIYYGCKYLAYLRKRYSGNYRLTLVAYYSGMKWADYLSKGKLRKGKFKTEIIAYATSVLNRSVYMEVPLGQKVEVKKVNNL